jgi:hypothetical protein
MKGGHARASRGLSPEVQDVISAVLSQGGHPSPRFFRHPRLGEVYRAYVISQVLDTAAGAHNSVSGPPASTAAHILASFGLTGQGSENWIQLYEHLGSVVAAAATIGKRMGCSADDLAQIRPAALLHDATKRDDIKRYGRFANSLENSEHRLAEIMRHARYPETVISAAMNTGREDRKFKSAEERRRSIAGKGVVATIVGLADARTIGGDFRSLAGALANYRYRKTDRESQEFFSEHWIPYYRAVETYLTEQCPGLDLRITNEDIYNETVFPEVFGTRPSPAVLDRYRYSAASERVRTRDVRALPQNRAEPSTA